MLVLAMLTLGLFNLIFRFVDDDEFPFFFWIFSIYPFSTFIFSFTYNKTYIRERLNEGYKATSDEEIKYLRKFGLIS